MQYFGSEEWTVRDMWGRLRDGEVMGGEIWAAYRRYLTIALNHVKRLLNNVYPAKAFITSDHRKYMGDWGI